MGLDILSFEARLRELGGFSLVNEDEGSPFPAWLHGRQIESKGRRPGDRIGTVRAEWPFPVNIYSGVAPLTTRSHQRVDTSLRWVAGPTFRYLPALSVSRGG